MVAKAERLVPYLISVLVLVIVDTASTFISPYSQRFVIIASTIGLGIWLVIIYRSDRPLRYHRILFPLSAFVALKLILIPISPQPIVNLDLVLRDLLILITFVFIYDSLSRGWQTGMWENVLLFFALAFSLFELTLALNWYLRWWEINGSFPTFGFRIPGVFVGHPNILAGFLNLILPVAVLRLLYSKGRLKPPLWTIGFLVLVTTLYFSSSRAGWTAGLLGIVTTLGLIAGVHVLPNLRSERRKPLRDLLPTRFLILSSATLMIGLVGTYLLFQQAQTIPSHASSISSARSEIWGTSFEAFSRSPIWGSGTGSLAVQYAENTQIPPGFAPRHAHNLLLQVAAELGLIGVALLLWIFGTLIYTFLKAWGASPDSRTRLAVYAGAFVALCFQHLFDYDFGPPIYTVSALIMLSLMLQYTPASDERMVKTKWFLLLPFVLMAMVIASTLYSTQGAPEYWEGVKAGSDGNWESAREGICEAYEKMPAIQLYAFQCALTDAEIYFREGEPEALQEAVTLLRNNLEVDPSWPVHWANLSILEWVSGEHAQAIEDMERATEAAPRNPTFALNLGWMQEAIGNSSAAIQAYTRALEHDPWLQFGYPFIDSDIARSARNQYLEMTESSPAPAALKGWQKFYAGQLGDAEALFNRAIRESPRDSEAYAGLARIDLLMGRMQDAQRDIDNALFIDPASLNAIHAAGMIAQARGDEEGAISYFQKAFDAFRDKNYSYAYYFVVYLRYYLPTDLVPEMRRGGLTPEMVDSFLTLADQYSDSRRAEGAKDIMNRIFVETERIKSVDQ